MTKPGPLVLVAVVVVIAAGVVLVSGGRLPWIDGDSSTPASAPDSCGIPQSVNVDPTAAASGVRVVDQGLPQADNGQLSLGVVLENTSDKVAYRTRVTYKLFDAGHSPITRTYLTDAVIPVMLPGQRVGAGVSDLQDSPKAASLEVQIGTTTWLPRDALGGFSPVTAKYLRTRPSPPGSPPLVSVDYHETSANCRPLYPAKVGAVFRDAGGKIVGGDLVDSTIGFMTYDEQHKAVVPELAPPTPECAPGERDTWIVPHTGRVPAMDDARTEIYPFCDIQSIS
ncbi:hypothetical protein [Actinocrispum wychmicini]|uniref:Uncharacterized protein n=1 Tax=Actinocrispum wychmicini TaxID=1213861 RepID=A0A4R2IMW4_9PSEU|nr:hypothetical protein [Actinocrispum wychmicini]TCO46541.1 hypothetical protein EV192_119120 [Actinocrispum wychmicini]